MNEFHSSILPILYRFVELIFALSHDNVVEQEADVKPKKQSLQTTLKCITHTLITTLAFAFPLVAHSSDSDKKVTASGHCTAEVTPDRASVIFVIESVEKDAQLAVSKTTQLHEKLRDQLKSQKMKDLELSTSEYSVFEKKEWENNKNVNKGFAARLGLRATTSEIPKIGELLKVAAKAGIKETHSLSTYLSEPKLLDEKKKCLEIAAKNAREKAESLVKSLNARLGKVIQITERESGVSGGDQPMYKTMRGTESMIADGQAPTIEGQKQTLNQQVDVSFAIE